MYMDMIATVEEGTGTAGAVGTERMAQCWQIARGGILSVSLIALPLLLYISVPSSANSLVPSTLHNFGNNSTLPG